MNEQLSYGSYLRVADLTDLQRPLSRPEHHDEMLFIIIHQVYELWFKQLLHEIGFATEAVDSDHPLRAAKSFKRINAIARLLEQQVDVLETMTPHEFNAFRDNLNAASGFQSVQFRELEFLCGVRREETLRHTELTDVQRTTLQRRLHEPAVFDHVKGMLARRGFDVSSHDATIETLRTIYMADEKLYDLYLLMEDLIEFDERMLLWRGRHVRMVERMIGDMRGTGGSSGAAYLSKTLVHRFFPELWEVRSYLGNGVQR